MRHISTRSLPPPHEDDTGLSARERQLLQDRVDELQRQPRTWWRDQLLANAIRREAVWLYEGEEP